MYYGSLVRLNIKLSRQQVDFWDKMHCYSKKTCIFAYPFEAFIPSFVRLKVLQSTKQNLYSSCYFLGSTRISVSISYPVFIAVMLCLFLFFVAIVYGTFIAKIRKIICSQKYQCKKLCVFCHFFGYT